MTLNSTIKRLEQLALSHRQINHFFIGGIDEFLDDADVQYPACFCEIKPGEISKVKNNLTYNFTFYFFDLLGISSESLANEWEVKSDMASVAQDFIAMVNANDYSEFWRASESSTMDFHTFKLHDLCAGVSIDLAISIRNATDRCQVPATGVSFEPDTNNIEMIIQNYIYTGQGTEGIDITVGTLVNKSILMLFKGDKLHVPVNSNPTPGEYVYTANSGTFEFGNDIEQEQIIQILWKNI